MGHVQRISTLWRTPPETIMYCCIHQLIVVISNGYDENTIDQDRRFIEYTFASQFHSRVRLTSALYNSAGIFKFVFTKKKRFFHIIWVPLNWIIKASKSMHVRKHGLLKYGWNIFSTRRTTVIRFRLQRRRAVKVYKQRRLVKIIIK